MYEAIFFDLDGTLLGLDNDLFVEYYFKALAPKLAPYYSGADFIAPISAGIAASMRSDGTRGTLRDVFIETFDRISVVKFDSVESVFIDFYRNEFDQVRAVSHPLPQARLILEAAAARTSTIVLATIPVFPRIAIEARLRWAGLSDFPFSLITSFENMHFCKPNPAYYREIAAKIKADPGRCLMVGNDHRDDLAATDAGMETYLLLEDPLNASHGAWIPTYQGYMQDLFKFLGG
jgi:FMN phosphatase YigB (HAD superfamily)